MIENSAKTEVQCPVCGVVYFRKVRDGAHSVQCGSCFTGLYLHKHRSGADENGCLYVATEVWGGKKEFEAMFLPNDEVESAKTYGYIR